MECFLATEQELHLLKNEIMRQYNHQYYITNKEKLNNCEICDKYIKYWEKKKHITTSVKHNFNCLTEDEKMDYLINKNTKKIERMKLKTMNK
jgi:hypothetical protein